VGKGHETAARYVSIQCWLVMKAVGTGHHYPPCVALSEEALRRDERLHTSCLIKRKQLGLWVVRQIESVRHLIEQVLVQPRRAPRTVWAGYPDQQRNAGRRFRRGRLQTFVDRRGDQVRQLAQTFPPVRQGNLRTLQRLA